MKSLVVLATCAALLVSGHSFGQTNGVISGVASVDGKPLANITVRLRSLDGGQLVGNTTASAAGEFSFAGLSPGNFVVEMVGTNGTVIGTSATVSLTSAAMVAGNLTVAATAASLAAAGGAGLSATVIAVSAVGATLGTTAVVVVANDASPSR